MGSKDEGKINKPSHDYCVKKENVGKGVVWRELITLFYLRCS